jgi:hypothetical protein
MFEGRPAFVRLTLVAAAGVSCLAAVACGSSTTSGGGAGASVAASATSTVDPLASLTVAQVESKVVADAEASSTLTMKGAIVQSSQTITVDLGIKPGHGCTGTIGLGSKGSMKMVVIGKIVYMDPDDAFWKANAGAEANATIALVNGRYLKVSSTNSSDGSLGQICDVSTIFSTNGKPDKVTKGAVTTLGGNRVLQLKNSDGSIAYVTDTSKPQLVEIAAPKGDKNASGTVTVTTGAPVTLTAPPASQVIDGSKLGM